MGALGKEEVDAGHWYLEEAAPLLSFQLSAIPVLLGDLLCFVELGVETVLLGTLLLELTKRIQGKALSSKPGTDEVMG